MLSNLASCGIIGAAFFHGAFNDLDSLLLRQLVFVCMQYLGKFCGSATHRPASHCATRSSMQTSIQSASHRLNQLCVCHLVLSFVPNVLLQPLFTKFTWSLSCSAFQHPTNGTASPRAKHGFHDGSVTKEGAHCRSGNSLRFRLGHAGRKFCISPLRLLYFCCSIKFGELRILADLPQLSDKNW
ncbi:TPA: hypothetical protein ACSP3E_002358 [Aeromonas veronii]